MSERSKTSTILESPHSNEQLNKDTQFLYLHRFFFGGVTTFTAHLLYTLGYCQDNNKRSILHPANKTEKGLREFGYGLYYRNISSDVIKNVEFPFLTVIKDEYFGTIRKLNEDKTRKGENNVIVVIHDPRDINDRIRPYIRKWTIITIRKTVQEYLKQRFDLDSLFLYHPFYPYPKISRSPKRGAVSISRIGFGKNIDILLKANRILDSKLCSNSNNSQSVIKLYGCPTPMYVYLHLGGEKGDFNKYYHGKFDRSFTSLSNIISQTKFVVDLSLVRHDGGGTQYTFLEAIHNDCALILHRKWIEGVDQEYCDFKEGYNCLAVENELELAELLRENPDVTKIVQNAKKLLDRHTNISWTRLIDNN
jgi:hypothetical protein